MSYPSYSRRCDVCMAPMELMQEDSEQSTWQCPCCNNISVDTTDFLLVSNPGYVDEMIAITESNPNILTQIAGGEAQH